jgi:hypothetical protein
VEESLAAVGILKDHKRVLASPGIVPVIAGGNLPFLNGAKGGEEEVFGKVGHGSKHLYHKKENKASQV